MDRSKCPLLQDHYCGWLSRDYSDITCGEAGDKCIYKKFAASPWRPIAEAPRDGTEVFLKFNDAMIKTFTEHGTATVTGRWNIYFTGWEVFDGSIWGDKRFTHFALINPPEQVK